MENINYEGLEYVSVNLNFFADKKDVLTTINTINDIAISVNKIHPIRLVNHVSSLNGIGDYKPGNVYRHGEKYFIILSTSKDRLYGRIFDKSEMDIINNIEKMHNEHGNTIEFFKFAKESVKNIYWKSIYNPEFNSDIGFVDHFGKNINHEFIFERRLNVNIFSLIYNNSCYNERESFANYLQLSEFKLERLFNLIACNKKINTEHISIIFLSSGITFKNYHYKLSTSFDFDNIVPIYNLKSLNDLKEYDDDNKIVLIDHNSIDENLKFNSDFYSYIWKMKCKIIFVVEIDEDIDYIKSLKQNSNYIPLYKKYKVFNSFICIAGFIAIAISHLEIIGAEKRKHIGYSYIPIKQRDIDRSNNHENNIS